MGIKDIEKEKQSCLKKNSGLLEAFSKLNFANVMDDMKLQCHVYHNGTLVGNDVHKLTKNENISKISTVLNLC